MTDKRTFAEKATEFAKQVSRLFQLLKELTEWVARFGQYWQEIRAGQLAY